MVIKEKEKIEEFDDASRDSHTTDNDIPFDIALPFLTKFFTFLLR